MPAMSSGIDDRAGVARPREVFVARAILGLTILATTVGITFAILDAQGGNGGVVFATGVLSDLPFLVAFVAFPIVGYLLASRRADNAVRWLLAGVGAAFAMDIFMSSYSTYALHGGVGGRDLGRLVAAIDGPMWVPIVGLPATFLILLFPNGHLPSPRWRWFARVLGCGLVLVFLAIHFGPGKLDNSAVPDLENPLGFEALRPALPFVLALVALLPIGIGASLVALVRRFRRVAPHWSRRAAGKPGGSGSVRRRGRARRAGVPARAATCPAIGRPARLRQAGVTLRDPVRVLRASWDDLRERGVAAEDGSSARGRNGGDARGRVGPRRPETPVGSRVPAGRGPGRDHPHLLDRGGLGGNHVDAGAHSP
jgi:hypothetical protein